jgi:DNA-binding response OmpR family regulator
MITAKKTALVIDDDESLGEALRDTFESIGIETTYCFDGRTAIELCKERCFTFIVTDYRMPGMDGVETSRALRLQCPDVFIVGLSADDKRKEFIEAGANVFFSKPFSFQTLASLIEKIAAVSDRMK